MIDITYTFPDGFLWGTATSAHQVEGGNDNNDWWLWEQEDSGHIFENQVSGQADDWWNGRAEEDIARMAELHTNTHRMSVEWSRIEPKPGEWSDDAIARYREILTAMHQAGITEPSTPFSMMVFTVASGRIAGQSLFKVAPTRPSPLGPWQTTQFSAYNLAPCSS